MKNMVARQMLAATGIFTPGADRFHSGNHFNTSGSDCVATPDGDSALFRSSPVQITDLQYLPVGQCHML